MNSSQPTYRYPGAQPFKTSQRNIFFGREEDIQQLYELISLENLVVLYGKSGLGKSSLLNAGILPKVEAESDFEALYIRFGAHIEGSEVYNSPIRTSISHLQTPDSKEETSYLDKLLPNENSLWYHAKKRQSHYQSSNVEIPPLEGARGRLKQNEEEKNKFLLVFDQFEELFTYPKSDVLAFGQQLKELLNRQIPQRFRAALEAQFDSDALQLSEEELEQLHDAFEVKVVMAIRSDRMSLLNDLKDSLPNILRHCYELQALSAAQAEDAILNPAHKKDSKFISQPFDYDNEALDNILAFLTKNHTQKIESFQLQIVCEAIEKKVVAQQLSVVRAEVIGNLAHILKNHYDHNIAALGTAEEQLAARRLIEEGLILEEEERRLSLYEGQIYRKYGISPELLQKLVNSHLLRAEPSMQGGYTYELSHDTLVVPVLIAKKRRKEQEEKQRLEAEKIARERELAEQKRQLELERQRKEELANALQEAERQREIAEEKQREAERNEYQAKRIMRLAFGLFVVTLLALLFAAKQYLVATTALEDVDKNAVTKLREAQAAILKLDYEVALKKASIASGFEVKVLEEKIVEVFMECAFWFMETHNYAKAREVIEMIVEYKSINQARQWLQKAGQVSKERIYFNECLKIINADFYNILQKRYYPNMIELNEGSVDIGDEGNLKAKVSAFKIAETETTVFQFALYCRVVFENRWRIDGYYPYLQGKMDMDSIGLHPVVNVNWYDAVRYSNWLSKHLGYMNPFAYEIKEGQSFNYFGDWEVTLDLNQVGDFRLPTEFEWEYAAKGGNLDNFFKYSGSDKIEEVAWYFRNSINYTKPVKGKNPNQKGLYDMSGNVYEWCFDRFGDYPSSDLIENYIGKKEGINRVLRGGSWNSASEHCMNILRFNSIPHNRKNIIGFRVAQSL